MIAYQEIRSPKFNNVVKEAVTQFYSPKDEWINWEDCGLEFTCTGLYNGVYKVTQAQYITGSIGLPKTFDIVSNNKETISTAAFKDAICTKQEKWNAYVCDPKFGLLIFDSLDADRLDRNVAPVHIKNPDLCNNDGECFDNRLNSLMDNCWDGFYGC